MSVKIEYLRTLITTSNGQSKLYSWLKDNYYRTCDIITNDYYITEEAFSKGTQKIFELLNSDCNIEHPISYFKTLYKNIAIHESKINNSYKNLVDITCCEDIQIIQSYYDDIETTELESKFSQIFDDNEIMLILNRRFDGIKFKDIANELCCTENRIKLKYYRAIDKVKEYINKN